MPDTRRTCRSAVLAVLLAATLLVVPGPAASPAVAASEAATAYARQAFEVTNNIRENRDLKRLRRHKCLQRHANAHAKALAGTEELEHQPLNPILQDCDLSLVGENLAIGFATGRAAVRKGWMKSPPHRANILEPRYRLMAIAARKGVTGQWVAVQLFGRR